jgi:hypothetical protein
MPEVETQRYGGRKRTRLACDICSASRVRCDGKLPWYVSVRVLSSYADNEQVVAARVSGCDPLRRSRDSVLPSSSMQSTNAIASISEK